MVPHNQNGEANYTQKITYFVSFNFAEKISKNVGCQNTSTDPTKVGPTLGTKPLQIELEGNKDSSTQPGTNIFWIMEFAAMTMH